MDYTEKSGKYRALVVDDDRTCRELAIGALSQNDFIVDHAKDGSEAILLCEASVYDMIFMDIEMPGLDGLQTAKAIRKLENGSKNNVYIMALTGRVKSTEEALKCFDAGMNDIMMKPFSVKMLRDKLLIWVQKKGGLRT